LEKYKKIGQWYVDQKRSITSEDSKKYIFLSDNLIIKKDLDETIEYKKDKNNLGHKQMYQKSENKLLEFIEEYNCLPTRSTNLELYTWFYDQARKIKSKEDKKYIAYKNNKIITNFFDTIIEKNNKRDKSNEV